MSCQSLSRQFNTTREEIISKFRQRINNGKRNKLTSQELEELINIFITRLAVLDSCDSIKQVCAAEIDLLEEGYPAASVAKNYLPQFRKAISRAIEEGRIPLNASNSHQYTYTEDGELYQAIEHWGLSYLKYTQAEYEQFAHSTITNNNLKQDDLKPVVLKQYLETVNCLLDSSNPMEMAIALAAVTGRRYSEVMSRGNFSLANHPYQVVFSGQLKKRSKVDSFHIYTLVPASIVCDVFVRFKKHPEIAALDKASIQEINRLNTPINRVIEQYFRDNKIVPVLAGEKNVTIQNLRSIYGEIALHFFCPHHKSIHRFVQRELGHLIDDAELSRRKNSSSTEHYFHYYLLDDNGELLSDKGVLLRSKTSPAASSRLQHFPHQDIERKIFSEQIKFQNFDRDDFGSKLQNGKKLSPKPLNHNTHRENFSMNYQHNNVKLSKVNTIPSYLIPRLEEITHQLDLSSAEAIEKSFQWVEIGIALSKEFKLDYFNPHLLFERIENLKEQLAALKSGSSSDGSNLYHRESRDSRELRAARQQIANLTDSLNRVTELLYKAETSALPQAHIETYGRTFEPSYIEKKTESNRETKSTNNRPSDHLKAPAEFQISSKIKEAQGSNRNERDRLDSSKSKILHTSTNRTRKRDTSATIIKDINHAIDAIMEFNNTKGKPHQQKFYIGVGSIKELTGRNDNRIREVLERRKDEINQHLKQHHLDQNHNLSRPDEEGNQYSPINKEPELAYHKITQVKQPHFTYNVN